VVLEALGVVADIQVLVAQGHLDKVTMVVFLVLAGVLEAAAVLAV
jgi:hypothetical protein